MKDLDIEEPTLSRKRKIPQRYEDGAEQHIPETVRDIYRMLYFESYDYVINVIKDRFNQPDYRMHASTQNIILMAARGENFKNDMYKIVFKEKTKSFSFATIYQDDVNMGLLESQLQMLPTLLANIIPLSMHNIFAKVRGMSSAKRSAINQVIVLIKLLVVAPATNAGSERVFSAMKRVKTYLRSTMKNKRLNHLMILTVHKDKIDDSDPIKVANTFVGSNQRRRNTLGVFTEHDILQKSRISFKCASTQT
jgi:hypothetical protein